MQDYHSLRVWRLAHSLTLDVYRATHRPTRRGDHALLSQLRRAAISVGANIAEGCGCDGRRELARFLQIAAASAHELEYHLLLARDLGAIPSARAANLADKATSVKRMLTVLIQRGREQADVPPAATRRGAAPPPFTDNRLP